MNSWIQTADKQEWTLNVISFSSLNWGNEDPFNNEGFSKGHDKIFLPRLELDSEALDS